LYLTAANFYADGKRRKKPSIFLYECIQKEFGKEFDEVNKNKVINVDDIKVLEDNQVLDYEKLGLEKVSEFSYTQIRAYEMCPAQYKYEYVLKLPTPQSSAGSFGSTIHNTLKFLYEQLKTSKEGLAGFISVPTLKELLAYYEKSWISAGYDSNDHEKKRFEGGKEVIKDYFKKMFSPDEKPFEIEKDFKFAIDDFNIKGRIDRIDLVGIDKDGKKMVEIIDYKTGRDKEIKEVQKEWQLQLYAYIVEELFGYKVIRASYVFVEHGSRVDISLEREKISKVIDHIKEIVGKIRKGDFTIPSGHECKYCNFKDICENPII
jgi:DNA helicase-2/ATP-dependent DNA helicase PcrA